MDRGLLLFDRIPSSDFFLLLTSDTIWPITLDESEGARKEK